MADTQRKTAVGVFHNRSEAQQAVAELRRAGFRDDQIGVAHRDDDGGLSGDGDDEGSYAGEGALTGAAAGAGVGALWGLGIIAGLLPAIGPAIAGGTLAAILASAATGAAAAGLAGALIGLGISKEEAEYYEDELEAGRTIVTIEADGRFDEAVSILRRFNGYDYSSAPERTGQTTAAMGGKTIQAHEEELQVRKQPVQAGEVKVRKEVHTEHRTLEVPVKKEEVIVERLPVSGREASGASIGANEEIRIPVSEEQVHIEKRPVVTEEVRIRKQQTQDTQKVSGTVRKEEIKIEKQGDVNIRDDRE